MIYNYNKKSYDFEWYKDEIPQCIYTPINNIELLKNKRLIILLWYADEI